MRGRFRDRGRRTLAAWTGLALLLGGCGRGPTTPLRVGLNPWPGYAFLFLAEEKGFFRDEGVAVKLIELPSLGDVRRAFERGQVDACCGSIVEFLLIREQSHRDARLIFVADYSNGSDMLLARPGVGGVAALRGRRVAVEPATLDVLALSHALKSAGLTLRDVTPVPMAQGDMPAALARGEVEAAQVYPPVATALLKGGVARLFDSSRVPGKILDVITADADALARRPDDFARLLRAFDRACRYAADHPADADRFLAGRLRMTAAEYREALAGMRLVPLDRQPSYLAAGGPLAEALREADQALREVGLIRRPGAGAAAFDAGPVGRAVTP